MHLNSTPAHPLGFCEKKNLLLLAVIVCLYVSSRLSVCILSPKSKADRGKILLLKKNYFNGTINNNQNRNFICTNVLLWMQVPA